MTVDASFFDWESGSPMVSCADPTEEQECSQDATSEFIGQSVRSTFLTPRDQKDTTHTSNFGVKVQEHCKVNQVTCDLFNTEGEGIKYKTTQDYLRATFKGQRP